MIHISIRFCGGERHGETLETSHHTSDSAEAIDRAVRKHWGTTAFFSRDTGLGDGRYGQIFEPTRHGNSSVTDRIRIKTSLDDVRAY